MRALSFVFAWLLIACGGTLAACGGTTVDDGNADASPSDSASTDSGMSAATYCAALQARDTKCGTDSYDATNCQKQHTCFQTIVRPEDRNALLSCFATRACDVSDDRCVADASAKYLSDPVVSAYVKACTEKRTACSSSFGDDFCGYDIGMFTDEYRAKVRACLDKPCAEVSTCFGAVVSAAGCK